MTFEGHGQQNANRNRIEEGAGGQLSDAEAALHPERGGGLPGAFGVGDAGTDLAGAIPVVKQQTARKIFLDINDLDRFVEANKSVYR